MFYVYIYLDPRYSGKFLTDVVSFLFKPFYVGKGTKDRWQIHMRESDLNRCTNLKKVRLIRKLQQDFDLRKFVVRLPCETEADALDLEKRLIDAIGVDNLTNLTEGGMGLSGYEHSDKFKTMIRRVNSKPKPSGFGERISKAKKGIPLTEEHKKALRGRKFSEEHKQKLRNAKRKVI